MSQKKQIDKEIISEEIHTLTRLIDQNNAVIKYQMEEMGRLIREIDQKVKENNNLTVKTKRLMEQIQIKTKDKPISKPRKKRKKTSP